MTRRLVPDSGSLSVVGVRDVDVLASVAWAGVLTTSQVERLHFRTRRRTQRRLRALLDRGLVRAHLQGEALHRENVYTLTRLGADLLAERDAFEGGVPEPVRVPRLQKLAHAIAIRAVFVAFLLAERGGAFCVRDFRFDSALSCEPRFKAARLVPDALVLVEAKNASECVGVEVDLGTETLATLRRKLDSWRGLLLDSAADRLLFVALTERRATRLRSLAREGALELNAVDFEALPALLRGWPDPRRSDAPRRTASSGVATSGHASRFVSDARGVSGR